MSLSRDPSFIPVNPSLFADISSATSLIAMNTFPLTQDDINDYLEFQNFKKMKQLQKATLSQFGNLGGAQNFNNLLNASGNSFNPNSIFPMTSSASNSQAPMLQSNGYYTQQSGPVIPKVIPQGMPLQLMRAPAAAQSYMNQKFMPNYGLKGGTPNYGQTSSPLFNPMPPSMPIQSMTQRVATPVFMKTPTTPVTPKPQRRRPKSPEIIVDDVPQSSEVPAKKMKDEENNKFDMPILYTTNTESFMPTLSSPSSEKTYTTSAASISLPSIDNSLTTQASSASSSAIIDKIAPPQQHHQSTSDSPDETHIIITARPRLSYSAEREETYTSEEDSDYDSNLRPKETPLQYKERMMERVMDKAKRKNEASKRSREKRKREHHDRQVEKQRLERRNNELTEKLYKLREGLKKLRPQICQSCNEQVQKFLDQCQSSKEGMNVFVLRPCKQDKCPGNKSVGKELGKFARRE